MKTTLTAARVLTWLNIIVWSAFLGFILLAALAMQAFPLLVIVFLFGAIPLHSFAALKLHKSIKYPSIKLSNQTPVGIRFIGIIALFFGIMMLANSYMSIQSPEKGLSLMKEGMADTKGMSDAVLTGYIRLGGCIALVLGLAIIINVILNLRLLRWYYLVKQSDVS